MIEPLVCPHGQLARSCEICPLLEEIDALRAEVEALREPAPSWAQQGADILAAAVDDAIRRGALDARSLIADCRLDYGRPFSPQEVAQHLDKRRHETNAARKP